MEDIKTSLKICTEDMENHTLLKMCLASQAHFCENNIMLELFKKSGFVLLTN